MKSFFVTTILILNFLFVFAQEDDDFYIQFFTNNSVQNAEEDYAVEIIDLWKEYLSSGEFVRQENRFWDQTVMPIPDNSLISLLLDLIAARRNHKKVQNNIIGIRPVKNDHFMLKTMFTSVLDSTQQVRLHYITTVYAKKINDAFQFVNSTQYHMDVWENRKVGSINYIIHPEHTFDLAQANKMNAFNNKIAKEFEVDPLAFNYVVCNDTDQLSELMAYDFFKYSYQPVASGGMADTRNTIIYAGNNSEHYPHEVVHLYNNAGQRTHHWVDEGIAAHFGGSTGYTLDWHLQKLRAHIVENPDFKMESLADMQKNIPNGEYMTDYRYVIGGLIMRRIKEAEGMQGLFDALKISRSDEDYFQMLEDKLGVSEDGITDYIKQEVLGIPAVSVSELDTPLYKTK